MRSILIVYAVFSFCFQGFGQDSSYPQVPFTSLTGISAMGENIITVGSCGLAMYSSDAGENWSHIDIADNYYEVDSSPGAMGKRAYLSTRDEIFVLDVDTEEMTTTGVTAAGLISGNFVDVHVGFDDAVIVGSIGVFIGGSDLQSMGLLADLSYDSDDRIIATSSTEGYVWVGLRKGKIFKIDKTTGQLEVVHDAEEDLRTIAFGSDDVGYIGAAASTKISKTVDGGVTWSVLSSFSEVATLHAYGDNVIVSQNTNRLLVSTDGGMNTEYVPYPSEGLSAYLEDLTINSDGTMYMVGQASTVLRSSDFGLTYENLNAYPRETINNIVFSNDGSVGFALGYYSSLLFTEDGGDTWTAADIEYSQTNPAMNGGVILEDNSILLCTEGGIVKADKTIGLSPYSGETLERMMYNQQEGYMIGVKYQGGNWLIRKSTDKGITWKNKALLPNYGYTWGYNEGGLFIVAIDNTSYMISRDHGESWMEVEHGFGSYVHNVSFYDMEHGLLSAGNQLYKTTDGAITWESISTGYLQSNTQMLSEDHYVFTSAQDFMTTVKETRDGGDTWNVIDSYCSQSMCSTMSGGRYWMGQRFGHLNFTEITPITSVQETDLDQVTLRSNMLQRGELLHFSAMIVDIDQVVIFDAVGNPVNAQKSMLGDEVQIATDNMTNGLYFVSLQDGSHPRASRFVVY